MPQQLQEWGAPARGAGNRPHSLANRVVVEGPAASPTPTAIGELGHADLLEVPWVVLLQVLLLLLLRVVLQELLLPYLLQQQLPQLWALLLL
jgi:hypothetical protein